MKPMPTQAWQVRKPLHSAVKSGGFVPSVRFARFLAGGSVTAAIGPWSTQRAPTCRRRAQILKGQSGSGAVDFVVFCKCTLPAGMAVYRWSYNVCTWGDAGGGVASFRECLLQRVTKTPSVSPSCSGACGAGHCCMASASPFGFWNASARKPGRNTCCALIG